MHKCFRITPKGYDRIDVIQNNTNISKNVFVAMQFNNTKDLRESLRIGIDSAGYIPIFIDEIQHNNLITPEILKQIRDCRMVVSELTHGNNGAYFEEGYATGIGKPVIQVCRKDCVPNLHFDLAQKNTVIWESLDDLTIKLKNRIEATLE